MVKCRKVIVGLKNSCGYTVLTGMLNEEIVKINWNTMNLIILRCEDNLNIVKYQIPVDNVSYIELL